MARLAPLLGAERTTSRTRLWRVTRSPAHPQTRAWSLHLCMTCPQSVQFVSWDEMGRRRRRRRLTRNKGAGMLDSSESGRAKSHAPAPGMRLRQKWPGGGPEKRDREGGSHLSLVACDCQSDIAKKKLKGGQEQLENRSLGRNDPIVEKEGLAIEISSATPTMHGWMASAKREGLSGLPLLDPPLTGDLRGANHQIGIEPLARGDPRCQPREVLAHCRKHGTFGDVIESVGEVNEHQHSVWVVAEGFGPSSRRMHHRFASGLHPLQTPR